MNATAPSINPRLAQQAYEAMRAMIESGRLRPGETVSEVSLAETLAISRTPVREAARRLAAQGLVETTPRGLRVFRPSAEEVAEVYFLRAAIEGAVARAAAALPTTRPLAADLRLVHAESLAALAAGDVPGLVACNGRFHGRLAEATGAGRAVAALRDLEPLVAAYRRLSLLSPEHRRASLDGHASLIDLLDRRDGEGAEALMRAHIAGAGRRVVEAVRHMEAATGGGDGQQLRNLDSLAAPDRAATGRTER